MSQYLELIADRFLIPGQFDTADITAGTGEDNVRVQAEDAGWFYDDWTALANQAGLTDDDWTRKYPDGVGGTTTARGKLQSGDYIGPWIWNELQDVCDQLKERLFASAVLHAGITSVGELDIEGLHQGIESTDSSTSWSDLKDDTETEWLATSTTLTGSRSLKSLELGLGGDRFASARRGSEAVQLVTLGTGSLALDAKADIYYYITAPTTDGGGGPTVISTFDADGSGATEDAWNKLGDDEAFTFSGGSTGRVELLPDADTDIGGWPSDPTVRQIRRIGWTTLESLLGRSWCMALVRYTFTQLSP